MYGNVRIFRLCMLQDLGLHRGFPGVASGKEPAKNFADTGDIRDAGSIPGSRRYPGGGITAHSSILAWRIPWTKEPGGL